MYGVGSLKAMCYCDFDFDFDVPPPDGDPSQCAICDTLSLSGLQHDLVLMRYWASGLDKDIQFFLLAVSPISWLTGGHDIILSDLLFRITSRKAASPPTKRRRVDMVPHPYSRSILADERVTSSTPFYGYN